jgi:RNA polymerase sigma factor (sigma-70 family)
MSRYHSVVRSAAVTVSHRWGHGGREECDDVTQEIYMKLCAGGGRALLALTDVQTDAVAGYLRVLAINVGHDYFRAKTAQRRGAAKTQSISDMQSEVSAPCQDMQRRLTMRKLDEVLQNQTQGENGQRDRAVFRLHYRDGMTAKEIAGLPGMDLTVKGVEAVIHRLTNRIQAQLGVQGISRGSRINEAGGG